MKSSPLLNSTLSRAIASLGHGQSLGLGDAGLPIPPSTEAVDLALTPGIPSFLATLEAVLSELQVEEALMAEEFPKVSPELHAQVVTLLEAKASKTTKPVRISYVPHEAFKKKTETARAVVRTGEFTPYANVLLFSGVMF